MRNYERSSSFASGSLFEEDEESCYKGMLMKQLKLLELDKSSNYESKGNAETSFRFTKHVSHLKLMEEIEYVSKSSYEYFSRQFHKWASHRLETIKNLRKLAERLETVRRHATEGRLIASCLDVVGTLGALVLRNVHPEWENTALFAASACSSIGLISSVTEVTITQQSFKDAISALREDQQKLKKITTWFRASSTLDKVVQDFFPFPIDVQLVKSIQNHHAIEKNHHNYESKLGPTHSTVLRKITYEFLDDKEDWRKDLCLAILISNSKHDPNILDDEEFFNKVGVFTASSAAQLWWNKVRFQEEFLKWNPGGKNDMMPEIDSLKKDDSIFDHTLPISLSLPFLKLPSLHSGGIILLNTLAAFNCYAELNKDLKHKASRVLNQLSERLKIDFENMNKMYDMMNPDSEYNRSQRTKRISVSSPFYKKDLL